jgi:hypothetical protein
MSDSLAGQRVSATYGRVLQIANANDGADATLRAVRDGKGDATPLMLSTTEAKVDGSFLADRVSIGSAAATAALPRVFTVFDDQTLSGTSSIITRIGGILRGAQTATSSGVFITAVDEDRVAFSNTDNGMSIVANFATLRAGWTGGRTLAADNLYVGNPSSPGTSAQGTSGVSAYHVAGASFSESYTNAGGQPGAERGNLFGRNDAVRVWDGSGPHWNSVFGNETDVGIHENQMALWKGGIKVVQWSTDRVRGLIQDFAIGINNQANTSTPGWRVGHALGGFEGYWPFRTDSTIMKKIEANGGAGNATEAGAGIDLRGITFGESSFAADEFRVDGAGNLGATVASGVALQTRSAINAKTATVNTITVVERGLFISPVTLTVSAPGGGGTTATATVATYTMEAVGGTSTGGTGHVVGETFTVDGGTFSTAATGIVTHVNGSGGVIGVRITNAGTNSYSALPNNPVSVTMSASGTGFTFTPLTGILTVTVSGAGTNYSEYLPPTVTSAGTTTYRQAAFKVAMTATAAPILLGNAYANYASFTGATATGVFDTGAAVFAAAGSDTHIDLKALGKGTNGRLNTTKLYVGPSANRTSAGDATVSYFRSGMTYATAAVPGFHVSGGFAGTVTTGQAFYHQIAINSDTVDPTTGGGPQGTAGFFVGHTVSAGAKGGRTAGQDFLSVVGAITANATGDGSFYAAAGARAQASASAGGSSGLGNGRGNLFGGNRIANLLSGATFWNSLIGDEITIGAETGSSLYYKNGFQIVLSSLDTVAGAGGFDSGIMFVQQVNGASPGWDEGISFGHTLGWWPIKSTGTIIGTVPSTSGLGPSYAAAWGIDFSAVTFGSGFLKSDGFEVDGSGRVKVTVYGNYADDTAAAAGGVPVTGVYRNGSILMVRVT